MRPTPELLELPYSFWQLPLLETNKFVSAAAERGVRLTERQLAGLHRVRLLVPLIRYQRNGRAIASARRRGDDDVWEMAHVVPTEPRTLRWAEETGSLHDPAEEKFIARKRLDRDAGEFPYRASEYLYSHHQLLCLPLIRQALPYLTYGLDAEVRGIDVEGIPLNNWRKSAGSIRELVVALSALEPLHYPSVVGQVRDIGDQYEKYRRWYKRLRTGEMIEWLGLDATWLRERAKVLLDEADRFDPLGGWARVVRESNLKGWERLAGEARSAVDFRIAAEVLLLHYERLTKARKAPALPKQKGRIRGDFDTRIKPAGKIDRVLTEFGISPHPRLILVVEGDTEEMLLPRVMAHFEIRKDREFIAIENARGVGRDLSALTAYAISPQTETGRDGRYLELDKPPTRLLTMMDAEGPYEIASKRRKERDKLTERILLTFPKKYRTPVVRESIEGLISVDTWDRWGQSFEFAHFTDLELARAIGEVFVGPRRQAPSARRGTVARLREKHGNIESMLGEASKLDLAEALWPVLENKIRRAEKHKTEGRIPIVRAIDRSLEIAHEYPRSNLVIPLEKAAN